MKIFINPGHGGLDSGACGCGLREVDVALNIGRRVENYLRAVGYDVKLFQFDGLDVICADCNAWNADLFVSIHCNAGGGTGTETFHAGLSAESKRLAELIQKQIVNSLPVVDRGVKIAGHFVTKYTYCPAVLVETAFIDNPNDAKLLVDREDDFARAIARGISDYYVNDKPLPDVIDTHKAPDRFSEHFAVSEFVCHCCGQGADKIAPRLIELLEKLRANIGGLPLHINSGYRCSKHNAEVGGVDNSQHLLGTAADVAVPNGLSIEQFKWYVQQLPFDWAGVYPDSDFIHVDVRNGGDNKPCVVEYME